MNIMNNNNQAGAAEKRFETSERISFQTILKSKLYELDFYKNIGLFKPINFATEADNLDCPKLDNLDGKTTLVIYSLLYYLSQFEYDFSGEAFNYICTHSCTAREVNDYIMNEYYK